MYVEVLCSDKNSNLPTVAARDAHLAVAECGVEYPCTLRGQRFQHRYLERGQSVIYTHIYFLFIITEHVCMYVCMYVCMCVYFLLPSLYVCIFPPPPSVSGEGQYVCIFTPQSSPVPELSRRPPLVPRRHFLQRDFKPPLLAI